MRGKVCVCVYVRVFMHAYVTSREIKRYRKERKSKKPKKEGGGGNGNSTRYKQCNNILFSKQLSTSKPSLDTHLVAGVGDHLDVHDDETALALGAVEGADQLDVVVRVLLGRVVLRIIEEVKKR